MGVDKRNEPDGRESMKRDACAVTLLAPHHAVVVIDTQNNERRALGILPNESSSKNVREALVDLGHSDERQEARVLRCNLR